VKRLIPAFAIIFAWGFAAWAALPARAHTLPVTSIEKLSTGPRERDLTQRVRIHGTITYYEPGRAVVLEDGSRSVWIATTTASGDLRINDAADATGFPGAQSGLLTLTDGEIRDSKVQAVVPAQPVTLQQLASNNFFALVTIEGEVVAGVREATHDEYVLSSEGELFRAVYSHLNGAAAPMKQIATGSRVRVTGICLPQSSNPTGSQASVEILLRAPDDIAIVAKPPLLAIRSPSVLFIPVLIAVIALGAWGWVLRTKLRRQAAKLTMMAYLEQRRGRILADINSSKPLVEIIE